MKKEIIEGNKLIAMFIELSGEFNENENVIYLDSDIEGKGVYSMDELKYHSSWDWLMPVVEKIESLGYRFIIIADECDIESTAKNPVQKSFGSYCVGGKKIMSAWRAVVEFIEWYDQNKQS